MPRVLAATRHGLHPLDDRGRPEDPQHTARSMTTIGTSDGQIFVSADAGATWDQLTRGLPPVQRVLVMPLTGRSRTLTLG
jgi:pyrroline-5-carboxylate reductase